MVAKSRRKRMVAHNIAVGSLLFAVMVHRRNFFQEDPVTKCLTLELSVMPPKQRRGGAMLRGVLIGLPDAQSFGTRSTASVHLD